MNSYLVVLLKPWLSDRRFTTRNSRSKTRNTLITWPGSAVNLISGRHHERERANLLEWTLSSNPLRPRRNIQHSSSSRGYPIRLDLANASALRLQFLHPFATTLSLIYTQTLRTGHVYKISCANTLGSDLSHHLCSVAFSGRPSLPSTGSQI